MTRIKSFLAACCVVAMSLTTPAHSAAIVTVTNGSDAGPGSLRQAIISASSGDTINFAAGVTTITLTSDQLTIDKNLTIAGPGANVLTIQRDAAALTYFRIFDTYTTANNISVAISGLTIARGHSPFFVSAGGIVNRHTLTLTGVAIVENQGSIGAGILNTGVLTIANSTLSGNMTLATGGNGGGLRNTGTATITNSTISGNSAAGGQGGGIINTDNGTLTLRNSTVVFNSADAGGAVPDGIGGGIYNNAGTTTFIVSNTIIAKNVAAAAPDVTQSSLSTQGYNLIGSFAVCSSGAPGDQFGCAASPIDPLVDPLLKNNGGPTMTHALLSGSPAIEAGNSGGANTDQRGFARPVDGSTPNATGGDGSDIGAYEVQADILPGCSNVNRVVKNGNDGGTDSLRDVISKICAGSTITFAAGVTAVNLTTAELAITKSLTISGPGANLLTVQRSIGMVAPYFRIFNINSNINVTISGLSVANGFNPGLSGGGIRNIGALTLDGVSVANNNALGGNGGGIYSSGTLNITSSTLSGNTVSSLVPGSGGGIFNFGGAVTIVNSTLSGNSAVTPGGASDSGGGIFSNVGTVSLINSTITGNSADFGGGVRGLNGAVVTARNTIIALNSAVNGAANGPDVNGPLTSQGFNLVGDSTGAAITPAQFSDQLGPPGTPINPLLGTLKDNRGPTWTHALLPGSPALDKGDSGGYTTDQRGRPRPFDLASIPNVTGGDGGDIGAFEFSDFTIDVDGDGNYDALTDGLLIVRYLSGLIGNALINDALGIMPSRFTPEDIVAYLDDLKPALDVDGNLSKDAWTDGLLLLRYLFGLRGDALISGAIGSGVTRTAPQIETYIQTLMP